MVCREGDYRFRLLETLRDYAKEKMPDCEDNMDALHFEYYLALSAKDSFALYGPDLYKKKETTRKEFDNFKQSLEWALENDPRQGLVLIYNLSPSLWSMGYIVECSRYIELLLQLQVGIRERNSVLEADCKSYLGIMYHQMLNLDEALKVLPEALEVYSRETPNDKTKWRIAFARRCLGLSRIVYLFYVNSQDDREILTRNCYDDFTLSLNLFTELDYQWGIAEALAGLAMYASLVDNDRQKALDILDKALEIRLSIQDVSGIAWSYFTIAESRAELGQNEQVIELLQKAKHYFLISEDRWGLANNSDYLGFCYIFEQNFEEARAEFLNSESLYSRIGSTNQIYYTRLNMALLALELGETDDFEERMLKIINRGREISEEFIFIFGLGLLLRYFQINGNIDKISQYALLLQSADDKIYHEQKYSFLGLAKVYCIMRQNLHDRAVSILTSLRLHFTLMTTQKYNVASLECKRITDLLENSIDKALYEEAAEQGKAIDIENLKMAICDW